MGLLDFLGVGGNSNNGQRGEELRTEERREKERNNEQEFQVL